MKKSNIIVLDKFVSDCKKKRNSAVKKILINALIKDILAGKKWYTKIINYDIIIL